jgi:hypothetical protein
MKYILLMTQPSHFNGSNQSYNWEGLEFPAQCWQLQIDNLGEFYMAANGTVSRG